MTLVRTQVCLDTFTHLPEHVITNTFYFAAPGSLDSVVAGKIEVLLRDFYQSFQGMFSPVVDGAVELKMYDMADPEPRSPFEPGEHGFDLVITAAELGLPEEVALALSYHAQPPITPRRRGRIYLGPIANGVIGSTGTRWAAFDPVTLTVIAGSAAQLITDSVTAGCIWSIYSPKDGVARAIFGGYLDNSPDTVRRRGHDPDARVTFG